MSTPNLTHIDIIARHHIGWWSKTEGHSYAWCWCGEEFASVELQAEHAVSKLADAGYSIVPSGTIPYVRVSETFTDDDGILRDSQSGDIVSTFDWPTLDSIPVGVTRVGSQIGRVAALSPIAGWYWADGEGFPEVDGYNGPWCEVAP